MLKTDHEGAHLDWFEKLTGFRETGYAETRSRLSVADGLLTSSGNGASHRVGTFEMVSLGELRGRVQTPKPDPAGAPPKVSVFIGDVAEIHRLESSAGALFQVASQFNMLEMIGPSVTPEDGVTRYRDDRTQGPACAIAAGAATLYRNYLVPVGGQTGQTADRQLDGLADLSTELASRVGQAPGDIVHMKNGYALFTPDGLMAVDGYLTGASPAEVDTLRELLRLGLHHDVAVSDEAHTVSQIFCSALPVAYGVRSPHWGRLATLVLEAAYEATVLAAAEMAARGGSRIVYLTALGGGAFGNDEEWIRRAMTRALRDPRATGLVVRLVSYGEPGPLLTGIVSEFEAR